MKIQAYGYSQMRKIAKTGDVFFVQGNGFFSKIIQFFTNSKVSHTGILYWFGDRLMISEYIEKQGFRSEFFSVYLEKQKEKGNTVFFGKIKHSFSKKEIVNRIEWNSGGQYDIKGALVSLWRQKNDEKFYCSEFVAEVLSLRKKASKRGFTPDDIAERTDVFFKIS